MPVNDFNECEDLEVMAFRGRVAYLVQEIVEDRAKFGLHAQALYQYPSDLHTDPELPPHIKQKTHDKGIYMMYK